MKIQMTPTIMKKNDIQKYPFLLSFVFLIIEDTIIGPSDKTTILNTRNEPKNRSNKSGSQTRATHGHNTTE